PSATNASTHALPIPWAAPVTSATFTVTSECITKLVEGDRVPSEDLGPSRFPEAAQGAVERVHHLSVGRGEEAHGPVGAEHEPVLSKPIEDALDVGNEIGRPPGIPVGFGDDARQLAVDVVQFGERRHGAGPLFHLA